MEESNLNPILKKLAKMNIIRRGEIRASRNRWARKPGDRIEYPYYLCNNLAELRIMIRELVKTSKGYDAGFILGIIKGSKYLESMQKQFKEALKENIMDELRNSYPPYKDPFFLKVIQPSIDVESIACPNGRIGSEIELWYSEYRTIESFKQFIFENENKLTALQIICKRFSGRHFLTFGDIRQLADAMKNPPYNLSPNLIWKAYMQLTNSTVKSPGEIMNLTNIISLVRYTTGECQILQPFAETVNERFQSWLGEQERAGQRFTPEQLEWLEMIKQYISVCANIDIGDLEMVPFCELGGPMEGYKIFGQELGGILEDLNEALMR
jgi:hypothetical protein